MRNGAGKTAVMRMILGLETPTSGHALIDGTPYSGIASPLRHAGAVLDGGAAAFGGRSAHAHLEWLAAAANLTGADVRRVLDATGIASVAARRIRTFSLGMKQRLGIAVALLGDPGTLLLDEPVNGLDPEGVLWIRTLMRRLAAEGRTILVSSHLISEMALTADHLIVIGQGRLLADAPLAELTGHHDSLEQAYLALTSGAAEFRVAHP